ncbi:50S ribosomal protein L23 [Rhodoflexus caldus]|jgi:large subunit ribosomal protein L23|uniref:50S ribosomal protein L23 n=1 Tax=Rhodoflexus caldus TaxID=2891236 RepID=UPI00202A9288|nr:50S ribosomal protein L23 [Rhodoflexus caldus]
MDVLIKPLITEKISLQNEKGVFGFQVALKANKVEIKKAVEEMYGVNVKDVRTIIVAGKNKSRFTKRGFVSGRTPKYKKAIVQLAEGEMIDFFNEE